MVLRRPASPTVVRMSGCRITRHGFLSAVANSGGRLVATLWRIVWLIERSFQAVSIASSRQQDRAGPPGFPRMAEWGAGRLTLPRGRSQCRSRPAGQTERVADGSGPGAPGGICSRTSCPGRPSTATSRPGTKTAPWACCMMCCANWSGPLPGASPSRPRH